MVVQNPMMMNLSIDGLNEEDDDTAKDRVTNEHIILIRYHFKLFLVSLYEMFLYNDKSNMNLV